MERWLPVVGFEGCYEVSDLGRVRSVPHEVVDLNGRRRTTRAKVLTPWKKDSGHLIVSLGRSRRAAVHSLVLTAFRCARPEGLEALHGDGDPENNTLSNLKWGTHAENMADRIRHGTSNRGERHGLAKLTTPDVLAIRAAVGSRRAIAEKFGVSEQTIGALKARTSWSWLNG